MDNVTVQVSFEFDGGTYNVQVSAPDANRAAQEVKSLLAELKGEAEPGPNPQFSGGGGGPG